MTNNATSYTPGPWELDSEGTVSLKIRPPYGRHDTDEAATIWLGASGRCLAICPGDDAETFANARLIAAAPEMRELLADLLAGWLAGEDVTGPQIGHAIAEARTLLARIDGGTHETA